MTENITIAAPRKSTRSTIVKKTLIIGAAAVGLILAGAVVFAVAASSDEAELETAE